MSYSHIWEQFEKAMSERLKTAAKTNKGDSDYNIVPDNSNDLLAEKSGYELVETAHPDQIQVADSLLNDAIVENGVEAQKAMIDIARRNPRGVIAELIKTLVKAANVLDQDMTEESLKMAKEIDDFLVVLGQQAKPTPAELGDPAAVEAVRDTQKLKRLEYAVNEALQLFVLLEPSAPLSSGIEPLLEVADEEKLAGNRVIQQAILSLRSFATAPSPEAARKLAEFVNLQSNVVATAIKGFERSWYSPYRFMPGPVGDVSGKALQAWNTLKQVVESDWTTRVQPKTKEIAPEKAPSLEQTVPGVASKMSPETLPVSTTRMRNYSVRGSDVEQLQGLVGVAQDGKFGPITWKAVMDEMADNYNLKSLLKDNPDLGKTFRNWTNENVDEAINKIKQFRQTKGEVKPEEDFYSLMDPNKYPANLPKPTQEEMDREDTIVPGTTKWNPGYRASLKNTPNENLKEALQLERLQTLYPELQIIGNRIYPFGFGRGTGKPSYPFTATSIKSLLHGGLGNIEKQI